MVHYRIAVLTLCLVVAGCGGGGGDNSEGAAGQKLTLAQVSWSKDDVIANTLGPTEVAASTNFFGKWSVWFASVIGSALDAAVASTDQSSYSLLKFDSDFQASRRLINGALYGLSPVVKALKIGENGQPELDSNSNPTEIDIKCDLKSAELSVLKIFELSTLTKDFIAQAKIPDRINQDCRVATRIAWLY